MNRQVTKKEMTIFRQTVDNMRIRDVSSHSEPLSITLNEIPPPETVYSDDKIEFFRNGIQKSRMKQLKKCHVSSHARLDLHGMTQEEARKAIIDFIAMQVAAKRTHLLVIHGKGRNSPTAEPAILKNLTNHLLRQLDPVLAFCSAQTHDGGTGALYILLQSAGDSYA